MFVQLGEQCGLGALHVAAGAFDLLGKQLGMTLAEVGVCLQ
jgi:hypothetical protein